MHPKNRCREKKRPSLLAALLERQERKGYLSPRDMQELARRFSLSPANVYAVATFYGYFRLTPPGKHQIKVCLGTACHLKQAGKIFDHFKRRLDIEEGGLSRDGEYSLERVACVGCCTLAPVALLDGKVIGKMSPSKADGILLQQRMEKESACATTEKNK